MSLTKLQKFNRQFKDYAHQMTNKTRSEVVVLDAYTLEKPHRLKKVR